MFLRDWRGNVFPYLTCDRQIRHPSQEFFIIRPQKSCCGERNICPKIHPSQQRDLLCNIFFTWSVLQAWWSSKNNIFPFGARNFFSGVWIFLSGHKLLSWVPFLKRSHCYLNRDATYLSPCNTTFFAHFVGCPLVRSFLSSKSPYSRNLN